ncbi:hypothetical protein CKF54_04420 [Psittacicella hinzii]|uniref:Uncharacterized protein n=1 Tax=Psittacicella hinzii TaxID=2028575 RepID=A0A3A1Y990_9GAMM|nr:hypothetical protein [Psittacicella hinzii]RIY32704.1 hypothetical protein CKF54_04420 [Psittacicella hinzii]
MKKLLPLVAVLFLTACDPQPAQEITAHTSSDAIDTDVLSGDYCNQQANELAPQCEYNQSLEDFDANAYANSYQATYVNSSVLVKVDPNNPDQVLPRINFSQDNPVFNRSYDLYKPVFLALASHMQKAYQEFYYTNSSDTRVALQIEDERKQMTADFVANYGYQLPAQELINFNFRGVSINSFEYPLSLLYREANNLTYRIYSLDFNNQDEEPLSYQEKLDFINLELLKIMQQMAVQFYLVKDYNLQVGQKYPEQISRLQQNGYNIDLENITFTNYLSALYAWVQQGHLEINPRDPMFNRVDLQHLQQVCQACQNLTTPFDYQFSLNRLGSLSEIFYQLSLTPAWQTLDPQAQEVAHRILLAQQSQEQSNQLEANQDQGQTIELALEQTTSSQVQLVSLSNQELYFWINEQEENKELVDFIKARNYFYLPALPNTPQLLLKPVKGQTFHYDYSLLNS